MSALTEALVTKLLADATVAAAVGARVFPGVLPQSAAAICSIVYGVQSASDGNSLDGATGPATTRVQIDALCQQKIEAEAAAEAARDCIRAAGRGYWGAVLVHSVLVEDNAIRDIPPIPLGDGSDDWLYGSTFDAVFVWSVPGTPVLSSSSSE